MYAEAKRIFTRIPSVNLESVLALLYSAHIVVDKAIEQHQCGLVDFAHPILRGATHQLADHTHHQHILLRQGVFVCHLVVRHEPDRRKNARLQHVEGCLAFGPDSRECASGQALSEDGDHRPPQVLVFGC